MELVERTEQLHALLGAFSAAVRGHGLAVLVSGEAGIGKSSLLRAFVSAIGGRGTVMFGACEDLTTPRTLGPFRDMAREHPALLGQAARDRDELIDVLIDQLDAAPRPVVIIIDDAHWADDASLDVIRYLARRLGNTRAMLVLSYREEDLSNTHPLRRLVGSLTHSDVRRIQLRPLSSDAVARLAVSAGFDPEPVVSLVGGNPFYLTEVLASPGRQVPASVRDAVLARLARLPSDTQQLLEVLSVIPGGASPELAMILLAGAERALDPARQAGVLELAESRVQFRHELARQVIEGTLLPTRRIECNRLVLNALLALQVDASVVIHHAMAAGAPAVAATFARQAARTALASRSYREAASFARLALDDLGDGDPVESARLLGCAAQAYFALNRFSEAAEHADRAVAIWDSLGVRSAELGAALLISARLSTSVGDPQAARRQAERALEVLEPLGPSAELALCYATLGSQDAVQARFDTATAWCDRAIELAGSLDQTDVTARALCYRGFARTSLGDHGGFADMRASIRLAQQIDHGDYLAVGANNLGVALIRATRHVEAKEYLDIAEQAARDHGLAQAAFHVEGQQCHVLLLTGRWDEAERRLRRLLAGEADPGANVAPPLSFLGRLLARRGDPEAFGLIERAWLVASATGEHQKMAGAGGARLEWAWLHQDDETLRRVGWELVELATEVRHAYLRAEALRYLSRVDEKVEPFAGCPSPFAAGITGNWARAEELWERAQNPYERALELVEAPTASTIAAGLRVLDGLGAVATITRVRRRLRARGVRSLPRGTQAASRGNPGQLTIRQVEVLRLVADGLTNAEIASRLVVSKRTVDNHLATILSRLGVSSRHQAVEAFRQLSAVDET